MTFLKNSYTKAITLVTLTGLAYNAHAVAIPAPLTVEYDGYEYNLSLEYINYTDNGATLESQVWWGDSALAYALNSLTINDFGFHLYGYAISGSYVSITYSDDGFSQPDDCPSGCPIVSESYDYVVGTRTLLTPLMTLIQAQPSLLSTNQALGSNFSLTTLAINGAHSRPMSRRVAEGQSTFWVAGDFGRDDHGSRQGNTNIAEFGVGHNYGPAQVNLSLGKAWASQKLTDNGDIDTTGEYLMIESIIPVSMDNNVFTTLGAYHLWSDSNIHRGYLNGGTQEFSNASPNSKSWGVKVRVDWENAYKASTTNFAPYADLSYLHSKLEAYSETGGAFPAVFKERKDSVTELRIGINSTTPIDQSKLNFVANLEGVHRFDGSSTGTSGEVVDQFNFNLTGENYDQDWVKAGMGVEGKLGEGKLSAMLNGTTTGSAPSTWVALSYAIPF